MRPLRLIPAWAGKTVRMDELPQPVRAHPRVGGENSRSTSQIVVPFGSSPRGRGKPDQGLSLDGLVGLIPAWAGKTGRAGHSPDGLAAHPRVGGENASVSGNGHWCFRLIPAWAGKTLVRVVGHLVIGAHPRVGGENPVPIQPNQVVGGSSPRGRGKHDEVRDTLEDRRLIPAWAGKT